MKLHLFGLFTLLVSLSSCVSNSFSTGDATHLLVQTFLSSRLRRSYLLQCLRLLCQSQHLHSSLLRCQTILSLLIFLKMRFGFGNKVILNGYYNKKIFMLPTFLMMVNGFFPNSTICPLMKIYPLRNFGLFELMEAN